MIRSCRKSVTSCRVGRRHREKHDDRKVVPRSKILCSAPPPTTPLKVLCSLPSDPVRAGAAHPQRINDGALGGARDAAHRTATSGFDLGLEPVRKEQDKQAIALGRKQETREPASEESCASDTFMQPCLPFYLPPFF